MKPLLPLRICLSLTLIAISATLLGLISDNLSWKVCYKYEREYFFIPNLIRTVRLTLLPRFTQSGSYIIIIAAGCGGIDQLLYLLFTIVTKNIFGSKIPNSLVAKVLIGLRIAIGVAALIFSFIQYYDSSMFGVTLIQSGGTQHGGHYTMEACTCQTKTLVSQFEVDYSRLCGEGKAARWLLVPYIVLSLGLLALEILVGRKLDRGIANEEGIGKHVGEAGAIVM